MLAGFAVGVGGVTGFAVAAVALATGFLPVGTIVGVFAMAMGAVVVGSGGVATTATDAEAGGSGGALALGAATLAKVDGSGGAALEAAAAARRWLIV